MERYIIISPHSPEHCHLVIDHFRKYHAGFLTHFEWGCNDHDHTAYAFIEAESHEQALLAVPPIIREQAKVVKLANFDPKEKDVFHDKKEIVG